MLEIRAAKTTSHKQIKRKQAPIHMAIEATSLDLKELRIKN
jgi:hypothetical protein